VATKDEIFSLVATYHGTFQSDKGWNSADCILRIFPVRHFSNIFFVFLQVLLTLTLKQASLAGETLPCGIRDTSEECVSSVNFTVG